MAKLPKLKFKLPVAHIAEEEVCDVGQCQFMFDSNYIVTVDGKQVGSYDELVRLASSEKYKDKEFIEVNLQYRLAEM